MTKHWTEYVQNIMELKYLYKELPELKDFELHKINLIHDGDIVIIGNLNKFADNLNEKWKLKHPSANTIGITLNFCNLENLEIKGWGVDEIADLKIEELKNNKISVEFKNNNISVRFVAYNKIFINVGGYCDERKIKE